MTKIFLITVLSMGISCTAQIHQDAPQELRDFLEARGNILREIGDLFIQHDLLSPWLVQMRDTQKELDALDKNGAMKSYALKMLNAEYQECLRSEAAKTAPKSPLDQELDKLRSQREAVMNKIIKEKQEKGVDVETLEQLDVQMASIVGKMNRQMFEEDSKAQQARAIAQPEISQEYKDVLKKLQALEEILNSAVYQQNDKPILDFLDGKDAQPYVARWKGKDGWDCTHSFVFLWVYDNALYFDFIDRAIGSLTWKG